MHNLLTCFFVPPPYLPIKKRTQREPTNTSWRFLSKKVEVFGYIAVGGVGTSNECSVRPAWRKEKFLWGWRNEFYAKNFGVWDTNFSSMGLIVFWTALQRVALIFRWGGMFWTFSSVLLATMVGPCRFHRFRLRSSASISMSSFMLIVRHVWWEAWIGALTAKTVKHF